MTELNSNPNIQVDINWYKENQLLSSVSRLCKHIKEIDMFQLAKAFGIDSNKYMTMERNKKDTSEDILIENNNFVNFYAKNGLSVKCLKCSETYVINSISDALSTIQKLIECPMVRIC